MDDDLWSLYRTFLAVAREGSLSAAARSLRLSQPTVGRHIEALERRLGGASLFTRSPRGLLPTETAEAMLPHVEAMSLAAASAARAGSSTATALSGTVRISASEIVGAEILPGMLAGLADRHPGLAFELSLSNRTEDLLRRESDIAVRMTPPQQDVLHAAWIGTIPLGVFGREDYLAARGVPHSLADVGGHRVIGFDKVTPFFRKAAEGLALDPASFALRVDSDLGGLAALRAGFGLGVTQLPLAARDSRLVRVLADDVFFELGVWIVMHEDLKRIARMRAVFDHLVEGMRGYVG